MTELLHKRLSLASAELKADGGDARTFSGYASKWGGIDAYGDTIVKGAYADTLNGRDRPVLLKWNHTGPVVGRISELHEDDTGLFVRAALTPGHSVAEDVYASLKHGAVNGLSIGYRIPPGGAEVKDGIRYLKTIDLVEISVVEAPADLGATVADVKLFHTDLTSERTMEKALREQLGLSKRQAKRFMSEGMAGLAKSDAEEEAQEIAKALREFNSLLMKG